MYAENMQAVEAALAANDLVLLMLKRQGCGVCTALEPQIDALVAAYSNVVQLKADLAAMPEAASRFHALTIPVVLLFYRQKEVERFARFVPQAALAAALDKWAQCANEDGGAV